MQINHHFNHASGKDQDNFACIAYRYAGPQLEGERESWIFQFQNKVPAASQPRPTLYSGLWQSPTGKLFVSDQAGVIRTGVGFGKAAKWTDRPMPRQARLGGVWGLHDNFVLTWGKTPKMEPVMFRFDGQQWHEEASPGEVVTIHGLSENLIRAAGHKGLIARREADGRWTQIPSPAQITFKDVKVVGPDEFWLTANPGRLFQGSQHGVVEVLHWELSELLAAAKFKGDLWVAGTEAGLLKLKGHSLEPVKDNIKAERLEVGPSGMLITSPEAIAFTPDGKSFKGRLVQEFAVLAQKAQATPLWEIAEGEEAVGEEDQP